MQKKSNISNNSHDEAYNGSAQHKHLMQRNYDKFLKDALAVWTVNDQQKLEALYSLHERMINYHNNIHVKDSSLDIALEDVRAFEAPESELANVAVGHVVKFFDGVNDPPFPVNFSQLKAYLQNVKDSQLNSSGSESTGFTWIHVRDSAALQLLSSTLNVHEILSNGFHDLRSRCSITPGFNEVLLTLVATHLEGNDFNMYKLYIYMNPYLVVTFQAELLPDLDDPQRLPPGQIVDGIFTSYYKIAQKCAKLGPMYFVYELSLQLLRFMDPPMEFVSRALDYFDKVVHLNLLHSERLDIKVRMHMIMCGVLLLKRNITEATRLFAQLAQVSVDGFANTSMNNFAASLTTSNAHIHDIHTHANQGNKFSETGIQNPAFNSKLFGAIIFPVHIPYLIDLSDSYDFVYGCLQHEFDETVRLEKELDATIQLRSTNSSMMLSLIATIFLPLTFLAGVFGMNFQSGQHYYMHLLNEYYGPAVFYGMCAVCFVATMSFFVFNGWLEVGLFGNIFKVVNAATSKKENLAIDDSSNLASSRAAKRAELEEMRRKEDTIWRRSTSSASRNFDRQLLYSNNSTAFHTGNTLYRPPTASVYSTNNSRQYSNSIPIVTNYTPSASVTGKSFRSNLSSTDMMASSPNSYNTSNNPMFAAMQDDNNASVGSHVLSGSSYLAPIQEQLHERDSHSSSL